jgi:hypothetical protein
MLVHQRHQNWVQSSHEASVQTPRRHIAEESKLGVIVPVVKDICNSLWFSVPGFKILNWFTIQTVTLTHFPLEYK